MWDERNRNSTRYPGRKSRDLVEVTFKVSRRDPSTVLGMTIRVLRQRQGERELQRRIRDQKVNPIQGEKADDGDADKFSLARTQLRNAQARPAHHDHGQCIKIEDRQCAIKKKCERVPLERDDKARMKKCHGRSRRSAGQAGVTGKRMKQTDRPR